MHYKITCLKCKASREVKIIPTPVGDKIDWLEKKNNQTAEEAKIISGRKRLDGQFGWACVCGNDDLLSKQEQKLSNKQSPDPQEITEIVKNLEFQKPQFDMLALTK